MSQPVPSDLEHRGAVVESNALTGQVLAEESRTASDVDIPCRWEFGDRTYKPFHFEIPTQCFAVGVSSSPEPNIVVLQCSGFVVGTDGIARAVASVHVAFMTYRLSRAPGRVPRSRPYGFDLPASRNRSPIPGQATEL
jgi:hypothetical protein